jgi:hypothetical protein
MALRQQGRLMGDSFRHRRWHADDGVIRHQRNGKRRERGRDACRTKKTGPGAAPTATCAFLPSRWVRKDQRPPRRKGRDRVGQLDAHAWPCCRTPDRFDSFNPGCP